MKRYTFAPMHGPGHQHPIGSAKRAICIGNEFKCHSNRVVEWGTTSMLSCDG